LAARVSRGATGGARARFELVIFDLDGTLVAHHEPIWKTLHARLGSDRARADDARRRALAGELAYADWFAHDLVLLQEAGATRASVLAIVRELAPTPGAAEVLGLLRAAGAHTAVLSGGIDLVAEHHLPTDAVSAVVANRLAFDAEGRLAGGSATPWDRAGKADGIHALAARFGTTAARVAFVGDGTIDVAAARAAGFAIAWNDAPAELRAVSDVFVAGPDLRAILPWLIDRETETG
jgi:phosphoserine phosphatase